MEQNSTSESSAATLTPGIKTVDSSAEAGVVGRYVLILGSGWQLIIICGRYATNTDKIMTPVAAAGAHKPNSR